MSDKPFHYRIYLLRVWAEPEPGQPASLTWRFRLEDPRTGQQRSFPNAVDLAAALTMDVGNDGANTDDSENLL